MHFVEGKLNGHLDKRVGTHSLALDELFTKIIKIKDFHAEIFIKPENQNDI